jgi:hypothetical protein
MTKKLLTIFLLQFLVLSVSAQINFAPVGAKWHFGSHYFWGGDIGYTVVESVQDSLFKGKSCRMLVGGGIFDCMFDQNINFLCEEDSVIYFYIEALDSFQILYDFSAKKGDSWKVVFSSLGELDSVQLTVDTVKFVEINEQQLLSQNILYSRVGEDPGEWAQGSTVNEAFGDRFYLFNFYLWDIVCDGCWTDGLRCYEDPEFGSYSTGIAESCTYVDLEENVPEALPVIFPNPVADRINLTENHLVTEYQIFSVPGRLILEGLTKDGTIDVSGLDTGFYLIYLQNSGSDYISAKFVKL